MIALYSIWLAVLTALKWVQDNWRIVLGVFFFIAFILASWLAYHKYVNYKIAQRDEILAPVDRAVSEGRIGVEASNTAQPKQEAVNASKQSNEAIENVNTTRNSDSRNFNSDERSARERFCRNYPDDSLCRPK